MYYTVTVYSMAEFSQPSHRIMCLEEPTIVVIHEYRLALSG